MLPERRSFLGAIPLLLLVFPFTCFGDTKVERDQAWEVGTRPVVVATSLLGLDEMNEAFRAEDQRQLQLLYDQGEILKLRKGDILQVFHVHLGKGKDRKGNKHPDYVECNLMRGNRKIRKVFVYRTIMVVFCKQVN